MCIKKSKTKKFFLYKPFFETGLSLYLETGLSYRPAQYLIWSASSSSITLLFTAQFYLNSQKSYKPISNSRTRLEPVSTIFSILRLRGRSPNLYIKWKPTLWGWCFF